MTMEQIKSQIPIEEFKSKAAYATVFTGEYQIARIGIATITIVRDGERMKVYPEAIKSVRI